MQQPLLNIVTYIHNYAIMPLPLRLIKSVIDDTLIKI